MNRSLPPPLPPAPFPGPTATHPRSNPPASHARTAAKTLLPLLLLPLLLFTACSRTPPDVVVYAAQDRVYAEPLLRQFELQTGLRVGAVYDSEAVKTVGLVNRLLAERAHPAADVFWGNEELRTRQLAEVGIFLPTNGWHAFGWRSRRVMINTNHLALADAPTSLLDLTNSVWRGRVALAYPLFGTTPTHFAALRQLWGTDLWEAWCRGLIANRALVVDGNSVVARLVARGEVWIGLTDSDDVAVVRRDGAPVAMLPLDSETLLIPNTLGIVRGGPNPEAAQQLRAFLTSQTVLQTLIDAEALEGNDLDQARADTLQPDWPGLLQDLDDTLDRLTKLFLR